MDRSIYANYNCLINQHYQNEERGELGACGQWIRQFSEKAGLLVVEVVGEPTGCVLRAPCLSDTIFKPLLLASIHS